MKPEDRKAFAEVILAFAELKGKPMSLPAVDLYWSAMQGWEIQEFRDAASQLLQTCQFMPMPKDFMDLRKASRPDAGEAFAKAMAVARDASWSSMGSATSGDPIVDAAARACGGYRALALSDESKVGFLERSFTEHFESVSDREMTRSAVPQLAGPPKHDISGLLKGLKEKTRLLD